MNEMGRLRCSRGREYSRAGDEPGRIRVAGDRVLHWRGINHLALVTTDMDATVRFYHGVLGAELVATIGTPSFRHYFFSFGEQCTVAFFEYADAAIEPFAKPAGVPDPR